MFIMAYFLPFNNASRFLDKENLNFVKIFVDPVSFSDYNERVEFAFADGGI